MFSYVCNGYMHHGKNHCPSHSLREDNLDTQVVAFAESLRKQLQAEQDSLTVLRKQCDKTPRHQCSGAGIDSGAG